MNDISSFSKERIEAVMEWFKVIKVFDGKKPNTIAYEEKIFSKEETLNIINDTHEEWKKLASSREKVYEEIRQKFHML